MRKRIGQSPSQSLANCVLDDAAKEMFNSSMKLIDETILEQFDYNI